MAIRTFLDANVLLEAHSGNKQEKERCLAIINDRRRVFVASPFLHLEVIPKAVYYRQQLEIEFYKTYFDNVRIWVNDLEAIVSLARQESERCGMAALDALHVAAAHLAEAESLYTLERSNKPIHRTSLVRVIFVDVEIDPPIQREELH